MWPSSIGYFPPRVQRGHAPAAGWPGQRREEVTKEPRLQAHSRPPDPTGDLALCHPVTPGPSLGLHGEDGGGSLVRAVNVGVKDLCCSTSPSSLPTTRWARRTMGGTAGAPELLRPCCPGTRGPAFIAGQISPSDYACWTRCGSTRSQARLPALLLPLLLAWVPAQCRRLRASLRHAGLPT